MTSSRDFISKLIEQFRDSPCLWNVHDPAYHDKNKKRLAINRLTKLFQVVDPSATNSTVRTKLSSLRKSFKKELNKVKASVQSGGGTRPVHIPKLWYFHKLCFLENQETPDIPTCVESILNEMPKKEDDNDIEGASQLNSCEATPANKKIKLEKIDVRIDQNHSTKHSAYGEYVAQKLEDLPERMVPVCQRMINEAIYLAEVGLLNHSSRLVTDSQPAVPAAPTP